MMSFPEDDSEKQRNLLAPAGARISEYPVRQLLSWGIKQIQTNADHPNPQINIIDELFRIQGSKWCKQFKKWLREHKNITVAVNYPQADFKLPWICVVNASDAENTGQAYLGDQLGRQELGVLGGVISSRESLGTPLNTTLRVYIAAETPDETLFLNWICWFLIYSNKKGLHDFYDMYNISLSSQDLKHDPELFPSFCYMKVITLQFGSMFDYSLPEEARKIVSLSLAVATDFTAAAYDGFTLTPGQTDIGAATITPVPDVDPT